MSGFLVGKMVVTSVSFVKFNKMKAFGDKSSSTIIAFNTVPSIPNNTIEESSENTNQTSAKEEVPVDPPDHHARLVPFMFPTLGDLPGLLLSSTVGAVFHNAQVEQLRNRFVPSHRTHHGRLPPKLLSSSHDRGDEELGDNEDDESNVIIETWSAFARRAEHDPSRELIPPDTKHFVRIPVVTPSGQEIGEEDIEIPHRLSEHQVVPTEMDDILGCTSNTPVLDEDALTKGPLWVDKRNSKASVESMDAAKESYFQRIYVTLTILGVIAFAYLGVAFVMFYKYFLS